MALFQSSKLGSVPSGSFPLLSNRVAQYSMTHLMIEQGREPMEVFGVIQLLSYANSKRINIARCEGPELPPFAPDNAVFSELSFLWEIFVNERLPNAS